MAMTKKEKAAFDDAILRAETLAALRWTSKVDADVPPPKSSFNRLNRSVGWTYNAYSKSVYKAWSGSVSHGIGVLNSDGSAQSASKGRIWLYSTKAKALAALRNEVERDSALQLLLIDRQIAKLGECEE